LQFFYAESGKNGYATAPDLFYRVFTHAKNGAAQFGDLRQIKDFAWPQKRLLTRVFD